MAKADLSKRTVWLGSIENVRPEAIWKNKGDYCKAAWRTNYAWLAGECKRISDEKTIFEKVDKNEYFRIS